MLPSGWQSANGHLGGNGNINTIKQTTSELHSNALSAGFQFTEFKAPCGVYLKVTVDPTYDDVTRNMIFKDNNLIMVRQNLIDLTSITKVKLMIILTMLSL